MKSLNELIKNNTSAATDPLLKDVCMIVMCGTEPPLTPLCELRLNGCGGDPGINPPLLKDVCCITVE